MVILEGFDKFTLAALNETAKSYGTEITCPATVEINLTYTQPKEDIAVGKNPVYDTKKTVRTAKGTITIADITRETLTAIYNKIALAGGGFTSGSMHSKSKWFGLNCEASDGEIEAQKCWYKVRFLEPEAFNPKSIKAGEVSVVNFVAPIECFPIWVANPKGGFVDVLENEFDSVNEKATWSTIKGKITYPTMPATV